MTSGPDVLDAVRTHESSLRPFRLARPLEFGVSGEADLRLLHRLREATSHAVRLDWTLAGRPGFPLHTHVHLVPPSRGVDDAACAYAREWRAGYRYAAFYYRQGPEFVSIKDIRTGGDASRMLIEGEDAAGFLRMAATTRTGDLTGAVRAMLADAEEFGLVLRAGDAHLALPYRMRNWPIPAVAG
jgi:hypothetical protein